MIKEKRKLIEKNFYWLFYVLVFSIFFANDFARAETSKSQLSWSSFQEPEKEYRPFVRWWLPGNYVEESELRREVALLEENWFGGAEIQPFQAGLGKLTSEEMARVQSVDTDSFYRHLAVVMDEAKKRGLLIDLTLGSGWPSGGSHIKPEQSMKTMLFGESTVEGPSKGEISIKVPAPAKPAFYELGSVLKFVAAETLIRFMPDKAELITVVAGKIIGGKRSSNPLNLNDSIELDMNSIQVLGRALDGKGNLHWRVPEGKWQIIAIYIAPDGQYLNLSASPEPAFVADHFDAETFRFNLEHLLGERTGLNKYYGAPFRGFFNDSFELKTERIFTRDFLNEFQKRRGYDLTPYLPAVLIPGADNMLFTDGMLKTKSAFTLSDEDKRIQYDYQLTVSDLFIERFIDTSAKWAESHGLTSRVQAYGLNVDSIKAYGHSQIPETEQLYAGGYKVFLKLASSAGHLYNRPIISAESMVWMAKPYQSTPLKFKVSADKLFSSGINQVIYHGFPYRKKDERYGETGWYPWGGNFSENVSEANPFWRFIPEVNKYISRCQYLLRQGKPETEILIYYPFFGFPTSFDVAGRESELLFNGEFDGEPKSPVNALVKLAGKIFPIGPDERAIWRAQILPLVRELEANGFTWDWVNDDSILDAIAKQGKIFIRGNQWKAIVIFNTETMPVDTAQKLKELSEKGASVLIIGNPPKRQPGYKDYIKGDAEVQEAMKSLIKVEPSEFLKALAKMRIQPEMAYPGLNALLQQRRRLSDGSQIIFLANQSDVNLEFNLRPLNGCDNPQWLDAWTGHRYKASVEQNHAIPAELPAYGSMFLICGMDASSQESVTFKMFPEKAEPVKQIELTNWNLTVSGDDIKGKKFSAKFSELNDWRKIQELRFCSSPGIYQAEFEMSEFKPGQKANLQIKWVYGAAEVKINGRSAGNLIIPPFQLEIGDLLTPGKNKIEIILTPALHNRLVGQNKGKESLLIPAGLIGPAKILLF